MAIWKPRKLDSEIYSLYIPYTLGHSKATAEGHPQRQRTEHSRDPVPCRATPEADHLDHEMFQFLSIFAF